MENNKKLIAILPMFLAATAVLSFVPLAHGYGAGANWQVGIAGTFVVPGNQMQSGGFWGWCEFGGATSSPPTSGTDADCEITQYFNAHMIQVHEHIAGTSWNATPCTFQPCLTPFDFAIPTGSMTWNGPTASQLISIAGQFLLQAGCTISGTSITCPLTVWESIPPGCAATHSCIYSPDTGIPLAAGHYNLNSLLGFLGVKGEFQIQVTQIP